MATSDDASPRGSAPQDAAFHRPSGTDEGGDPACWLQLVCPDCGRLSTPPLPATCPRCETPIAAFEE